MNEFSSKWWTTNKAAEKVKLHWQSAVSQVVADHEVPHWRKCWPR